MIRRCPNQESLAFRDSNIRKTEGSGIRIISIVFACAAVPLGCSCLNGRLRWRSISAIRTMGALEASKPVFVLQKARQILSAKANVKSSFGGMLCIVDLMPQRQASRAVATCRWFSPASDPHPKASTPVFVLQKARILSAKAHIDRLFGSSQLIVDASNASKAG